MDQSENWIKIAQSENEIPFKDNHIAKITVEERSICLVKSTEGIKACAAKCPHAGNDLSDAFVDKKHNIVCPLHGYRFSMSNGRDTSNEGYVLKIYQVKQTNEGVFIKLE